MKVYVTGNNFNTKVLEETMQIYDILPSSVYLLGFSWINGVIEAYTRKKDIQIARGFKSLDHILDEVEAVVIIVGSGMTDSIKTLIKDVRQMKKELFIRDFRPPSRNTEIEPFSFSSVRNSIAYALSSDSSEYESESDSDQEIEYGEDAFKYNYEEYEVSEIDSDSDQESEETSDL